MNRLIYSIILFFVTVGIALAQSVHDDAKLYNAEAEAMEQIDRAVLQAGKEGKHVLVQVGGDWCPWCIKLHRFIEEHYPVDSLINADYILVRVNYSKENKNPEAMARMQFPQRFGFPVLVILDATGKRLHTQNTAYLEEGESYSEKKLVEFLNGWNRNALNPLVYQNK